jgi:regulator of sigma E protease
VENILNVIINYVLPATILLGVLIFVHELGHFIVAKLAGVRVLKFSLGFGPKLIGKKIGDTEYLISMLPLGGYVKPLGESPDEEIAEADKPYSLNFQSVPKRFAILAAGSVFNLIFAFLVFSGIYMAGMPMMTPRVGSVLEDSPALRAGLKVGDLVESVDGSPVELWDELSQLIEKSQGRTLVLHVRRGGQQVVVSVTPQSTAAKNLLGESVQAYKIGITPSGGEEGQIVKRYNPLLALWKGLEDTGKWSRLTLLGMGVLIKSPIERRKDIGGPLLIGKLAGDFAQAGFLSFLLLMAMISVNLGVLNLLPVPILDGGHLFFLVIEAVKGSPVSVKMTEIAQQIGLVLLLSLMAFVFYNDITRLFIK